ncbi:hypothetical protein TCAP_07426 [Tolypocladium capitatum]|uniref:Uncharacterized protein n=1 Tax=Tolypocladium capitatum TaxID=45235 RepID=A0A2K3PYP5_9HYPO|nr:hypothetical protein TCAP_07426 [Tolypocladium capitatum]
MPAREMEHRTTTRTEQRYSRLPPPCRGSRRTGGKTGPCYGIAEKLSLGRGMDIPRRGSYCRIIAHRAERTTSTRRSRGSISDPALSNRNMGSSNLLLSLTSITMPMTPTELT